MTPRFLTICFQSDQTPTCLPSSFLTSNFSPAFHMLDKISSTVSLHVLVSDHYRSCQSHRCSAVFSPTLLPRSPQSLLIVLYLHNLSPFCLSFPVYSSNSECSHTFCMGKTEIHLNSNAFHITVKSHLKISQVSPDSVAAVRF